MRKIFVFILLFSIARALLGQKDETLFSNKSFRLTGVWGGSQTGITSMAGENPFMQGGFFSLEFNKEIHIGIAGMETIDQVRFGGGNPGQFKLEYGGLFLGYVPKSWKVIHPRISLLTGKGEIKVSGENNDRIFVIQPGGGIEVNVFRWFRIGFESGYRFVSGNNHPQLTDQKLSNLFGELKLRFGWSWKGRKNAEPSEE